MLQYALNTRNSIFKYRRDWVLVIFFPIHTFMIEVSIGVAGNGVWRISRNKNWNVNMNKNRGQVSELDLECEIWLNEVRVQKSRYLGYIYSEKRGISKNSLKGRQTTGALKSHEENNELLYVTKFVVRGGTIYYFRRYWMSINRCVWCKRNGDEYFRNSSAKNGTYQHQFAVLSANGSV